MDYRLEPRYQAAIPVEVVASSRDAPVELIATDISPRGAYLSSGYGFIPGEILICSFQLPRDSHIYTFFAEVERVNELWSVDSSDEPGLAVEFIDTTPLERLRIREHLRGLTTSRTSARPAGERWDETLSANSAG